MAKKLQLRRGTTSQHSSFTGAVGEVTVDTDKDVLVVHDGSTAGGHASVKSGAVAAADLASNAVTTAKIAADAVTDAKIAADSVGASELKVTGNGTSGQYLGSDADGTFTWTSISSDPSMGGDMSGTASNAQIVANAVTATEIASNAVTTAKILDANVTTAKIADSAVTGAKISNATITGDKMVSATIPTAAIANSAVTSAKIADGKIVEGDIAGQTITGDKLVNSTVNTTQITNSAVTSAKIADGNITNAKLASNSVNAVKIWAGGTANSGTFLRGDMQWAAATPGSASVTRSILKTSTQENSVSYSGGPQTMTFGSVGGYGFYREVKSNTSGSRMSTFGNSNTSQNTSYETRIIVSTWINPGTYSVRVRYMQASPPYDMGDGCCHTFIYAVIENGSGKIKRMNISQDPPWVYAPNGGLDRGCFYDDDKTKKRYYKRNKIVDYSKINDIEEFKELVGQTELVDYDMKLKMANMSNVPHPFMTDTPMILDKDKNEIIDPTYWEKHHVGLIDPVCDVTQRLDCISECGESALELFHAEKPYLTIDNEDIEGRCRPHADIKVYKAKWKNSK